ncbi:hypothetical protein FRX31_019317 [Thalictrum thalictroides]|uniref:Uncharacterized protein n=1 Tax=Thalictrum thalictroides TaxID=46969 RepID=A0A7J6W132_THATH|nr:hypothetical protein FRX31_019317 [Thalictrum thalictroides]
MLKPPVPAYNDLIPLLHSHELIRKSSPFSEHPNPAVAFVGERSTSRNQSKRGSSSSFNSRGRGFTPASSRPPNNTHRNAPRNPPPLNQNNGDWHPDSAATAHITDNPGPKDESGSGIGE